MPRARKQPPPPSTAAAAPTSPTTRRRPKRPGARPTAKGPAWLDALGGDIVDPIPERLRGLRAGGWADVSAPPSSPSRSSPAPPSVDRPRPRPRDSGRSSGRASGRAAAAVGYLRRSTDRQEQSIPDQQRAVEAYCSARGLTLLRCYIDDAISGTSSMGRKDFQRLVADAQTPQCDFGTIVCYDVKRFGRVGNDEAGYYRHILKTHGVDVHYASENFAGDGTDDLLRPVKQWQAREESKDLSKVTIRGLVTKSGSGHWMGGAPPYGYDLRYESQRDEFLFVLRYMADGSKLMLGEKGKRIRTLERGETVGVSRKDHCRLIPGEVSRVEVVRRIYSMYVELGMGFKAIADKLNADGVPPARGPQWSGTYSGQWAMTTVRAILINPAYRGDMVWNRRTDARFHRIRDGVATERKDVHARRLELNDEADWTCVRGAHAGLVSPRVWEQGRARLAAKAESLAQRGMDQRRDAAVGERDFRRVGDSTGPRSRFLLSKLVSCARCGSRYEGFTQRTSTRDAGGVRGRYYTYACGGYIRRGKSVCGLGAVPQERLEGAVVGAVLRYYRRYEGDTGRALLGAEIRKALGLEDTAVEQSIGAVRGQLDKLEATTRRLVDNVTPGTRAAIERRLKELEKERSGLEARAESLERMSISKADIREMVLEAERFIAGNPEAVSTGTLEQRQGAIRRCVARVVYDAASGRACLHARVVPMVVGNSGTAAVVELHVAAPSSGF